MTAFAVAAYHSAYLPLAGSTVEAIVWVRASAVDEPAVEVSLLVWMPLDATLITLREVSPATRDLRQAAIRVDDRTLEFPTAPWRGGARAYELAVAVAPRNIDDHLLAARVAVCAGGTLAGRALIAVTWTDDERLIAASTVNAVECARTAGVAATDLPTGRSHWPRPPVAAPSAGEPCPGCGARPQEGDRFCEACGHELACGPAR